MKHPLAHTIADLAVIAACKTLILALQLAANVLARGAHTYQNMKAHRP